MVFVAGGPPWLAVPAALAVGSGGRRRQRLPRRLCRHPAVHRDARRADRLQRPRLSPLRRQDDLRLGDSGLLRRLRARRRSTSADRDRRFPTSPSSRPSALLLVWVFLEQTITGRRLYAIGGNAEAARLAGVRIKPLKVAGLRAFRLRRGERRADDRQPRRLGQSDAGRRTDARRDRGGVPRHDHERGGRSRGFSSPCSAC